MLMTNRPNPAGTGPKSARSEPVIPETMSAIVARRYGTAEVLQMETVPTPTPGKGEVLIRVEASSLNSLDWHYLTGMPYFMRLMVGLRRPKRLIHGADVAGTVVGTGPDVTRFTTGDAVFGMAKGGGFAPYLTVDEARVVLKPATVQFETAGATPIAGLTALQGLRTHGHVQHGDHVLINGAAGGVGTFAVQIARTLGAEVTAICSSANVDMVKALGANHVVDYTQHDFVTDGPRFDVMLDNVGNRTPAECLSVLLPNGRYVAVSGPKTNRVLGPIPHLARLAIKFKRASQTFHNVSTTTNDDDLTHLGELLATGQITPEIQRTIGPDDIPAGIAEIGTGHTRAKIVVLPT